ncbi:hypothetical protein CYY_008099 [Polysphondylium violaceum]|uniref:FNIP repeat-containing protein n=1 Tax=Polysphondylium violaceum TaxID=133409 RepID=A0A8J4PPD1_9MYCE|nr:hypothetical protein CYY_008099 [Polysphondylium violaceum]
MPKTTDIDLDHLDLRALIDSKQDLTIYGNKGVAVKILSLIINKSNNDVNHKSINKSVLDRVAQWSMEEQYSEYLEYYVVVYDVQVRDFLLCLQRFIKQESEKALYTGISGSFKMFSLMFSFNINYQSESDDEIVEIIRLLKSKILSIRIQIHETTGDFKNKTIESVYTVDFLVNRLEQEFESTCLNKKYLFKKISNNSVGENYLYQESVHYRLFNPDTDEDDLPLDTEILDWDIQILPLEGSIPTSVKWLKLLEEIPEINESVIPDNILCLSLKYYNYSLSQIRLPPKLKFFSIPSFTRFLYRNLDVPETITHLEISIDYAEDIACHWLTIRGTLPRHVTHLKIASNLSIHSITKEKFVIPSSVQKLDIDQNDAVYFQVIQESEYYKYPMTRDYVACISSLKSMSFAEGYLDTEQPLYSNLFSSNLESLDISYYAQLFDANVLPQSLTSYTCRHFQQIPDHTRLNYLEYNIDDFKLIFKVNDRSITKDRIPVSFDPKTGVFNPKPTLPIEEFDNGSKFSVRISSGANIRKITDVSNAILPNSVQVYESSYSLPLNYPESLHTIILKREIEFDIYSIPPTVKVLHCYLTPAMMSSISKPIDLLLKDKYKSVNINKVIVVNIDSFFQIWRNKYLQNKIQRLYQARQIDFKVTRNRESGLVFNFQNDCPLPNHPLKFKTQELCTIPHGVTFCSFSNPFHEEKSFLLESLPGSVKKLKITYYNSEAIKLPPTIKHLVIKSNSLHILDYIPPSVEILELNINDIGVHLFENRSLTAKQVIIKDKLFASDNVGPEVIKYLNERNLFGKNQYIQLYNEYEQISPSTTVLVWRLDEIIPVGLIPFGVKKIIFGDFFNQTILENSIPLSVTEIYFGWKFDQSLLHVYLPVLLKTLTLQHYNHPIHPNTYPPNLTYLNIKDEQTNLVHLPKTIKHLKIMKTKLHQDYDNNSTLFKVKSIYSNPSPVDIDLIERLNQEIDIFKTLSDDSQKKTNLELHFTLTRDLSILPGSLNHLNIKSIRIPNEYGNTFNQALLEGSIPSTVTTFELRNTEYNPKVHSIPSSITKLALQDIVPIPLHNGIKVLECQTIADIVLPNTIEKFSLYNSPYCNLKILPSSVTKLCLGFADESMFDTIPPTVTKLTLDCDVHHLSNLPRSITKLKCREISTIQDLPTTVKCLHLHSSHFIGRLPSTLEYLKIKNIDRHLLEINK